MHDIPLAPHVRLALSTVRQSATNWGRAAAMSLVALTEGEQVPSVRLNPVMFVTLDSTSAPRIGRTAVD
jgi:DNA-binding LacI/PurR family transcriptional regulator